MNKLFIHNILNFIIATVWLVNGLVCKVLGFVPRHEWIVSKILGVTYSQTLTVLIGFSEIVMAIWILSGYKSKLNAILQISIILIMNTLEFILAPELLLWGKWNFVFAAAFCILIYFNTFILKEKTLKA